MMTQESLRPLTDNEMEIVSGGMTAKFHYGDFTMTVKAEPPGGVVRVDYTNGSSCGYSESRPGGAFPKT